MPKSCVTTGNCSPVIPAFAGMTGEQLPLLTDYTIYSAIVPACSLTIRHRSPSDWATCRRFDPQRPLVSIMPAHAGTHLCIDNRMGSRVRGCDEMLPVIPAIEGTWASIWLSLSPDGWAHGSATEKPGFLAETRFPNSVTSKASPPTQR